jgi:hypothetical protein
MKRSRQLNHQPFDRLTDQINRVYDDLYYLVDKYAPFSEGEGPPRLHDSERASLSTERDHTTT